MKTEVSAEKNVRPKKPRRVPLYEQRNKLTVQNQNPDLHYRFVNMVEDRVEKFKRAGWHIVDRKDVSIGDPAVDTGQSNLSSAVEKHVGLGVKAVLMAIPQEDYDEDQRVKQEEINRSEAAMRRHAVEKSDYGELKIDR